ncbi:MAG: hypothetical protein ACR2O4_04890, partial [Hyphomicrobiaceae bacterium]
MRYGFSCTLLLTFIATAVLPAGAEARCNENRLERFLEKRAFELSADEKIDLYADRVVRYYDKRDISRRRVYRMIRQWEQRWPERIYKFLRITDFQETDDR